MSYSETLHYLFDKLPMYQRVGAMAFKKDLTNIIKLCQLLDNPQQQFKSIHIAGTNGKGSVSHIIAAILQTHGYKVGVYTSPHYKDFRERIKINGEYIEEETVVTFVKRLKHHFEDIEPSFFEITVAMAFDYFAAEQVDYAIIETGLGGRLDSTNIVKPEIAVITNIGFDHIQFLGDTLPQIAGEKAGIIKEDTPVVIGETQNEIKAVFELKAQAINAPLYFANELYHLETNANEGLTFTEGNQVLLENFTSDIKGSYQLKNLLTALATVYIMQNRALFKLSSEKVKQALVDIRELTRFMGRWQQISDEPRIIVDSAHNEPGVSEMINSLANIKYNQLHIVWGTVNDKDLSSILMQLPVCAKYYFCKPNIPRGLDANELRNLALNYNLKGIAHKSVSEAVILAKRNYEPGDVILVSGSIFVVAEVL